MLSSSYAMEQPFEAPSLHTQSFEIDNKNDKKKDVIHSAIYPFNYWKIFIYL